jgi:hypothetical protein
MSVPTFSICNWRYPDYYDVDELPAAGQSYIYEDIYVSFLVAHLLLFTFRFANK